MRKDSERHIPDEAYIRRLEERYFAAETTLEEERLLRSLAARGLTSEAVAATLSYGAMVVVKRPRRFARLWLRVACCVAIVAAAGWSLSDPRADEGECVAYVGMERIDDDAEVMALMEQDLELMSDASRAFDEQIAGELDFLRQNID